MGKKRATRGPAETIAPQPIKVPEVFPETPEDPDAPFRRGEAVKLSRDCPTFGAILIEGAGFVVFRCWLDSRGWRVTLEGTGGGVVVNDAPDDLIIAEF